MKTEDYPALYQSADKLSSDSQSNFYVALLGHLTFLVIATGVSVLNSSEAEWAIFQALVLLSALSCAVYLFWGKPDRYWYGARAVAESIKTITWRFVSRAEPFNGADETDRTAFRDTLRKILEQNRDVAERQFNALDGLQITAEMARIRSLSFADRCKYYVDCRIADQQSWYAKKARLNKRVVFWFFMALIFANFLAVSFAVAKVKFSAVPYWPTDIFVSLAASLLAWIQAKRFQELAASYALTAHEISFVRDQSEHVKTDEEFSMFVGDAENAFSREHTQWVARKDT